ncbi:MAG: hypothetical protein WDW38_005142 [Sanguina aurantia]
MVTQHMFSRGVQPWKSRVVSHRPSATSYGDAYVNKLAGSTFVHHAPGYSVIPVVPFMDAHSRIPFSAAIECLEAGSREQRPHTPASPSQPTPSLPTASPSSPPSDLLDVFYVLSGEGAVVSTEGGNWPLVAGDCLVAWHGSVVLQGRSHDTLSSNSTSPHTSTTPAAAAAAAAFHDEPTVASSPSPDAMAVLRFSVPASLVLPSGAISATSRSASPVVHQQRSSLSGAR